MGWRSPGLERLEEKDDTYHDPRPDRGLRPMFKLSQETIAVVTVGLALAGLVVTGDNGIRSEIRAVRTEARADREALRAEARADRAEARADREVLRAEARTDREALRAEALADREAFQAEIRRLDEQARSDREAFEKHITRLTQEQSRLTGIVEQMRTASR